MKRRIPVWLFAIVFVWAAVVTTFCFFRNPLPFPDWGHRCFAVSNEKAAKAVVEILGKAGLSERFTFDAGPTHQTLLWDNTTVIMHLDSSIREQGLPPNGLSVVTSDPENSAIEAAKFLRDLGFISGVKFGVIPEATNKLVVVESDAFDGWVLVFRRHVLAMGEPPNKRKLLP